MSCYYTAHMELLQATVYQKALFVGFKFGSLSVVWKETHTCSINGLINGIHLIWQSV